MDEDRGDYGPSGGGAPRHLPGRGPFPRVDDHLVEPEVTRDQIIGGHLQEILSCQDLDRLSRWLRRAVLASSAGEVTSEP